MSWRSLRASERMLALEMLRIDRSRTTGPPTGQQHIALRDKAVGYWETHGRVLHLLKLLGLMQRM